MRTERGRRTGEGRTKAPGRTELGVGARSSQAERRNAAGEEQQQRVDFSPQAARSRT